MKRKVFQITPKSKIGITGFLVLLSLFLIQAQPMKSGNLYVYKTSSSMPDASYPLDVIRRLTFSDTQMIGLNVNGTSDIQVSYSSLKFFSLKNFEKSTGVATTSAKSVDVFIKPNPSMTNVTVTSSKIINGISLYNLQGKKLLQLYPRSTEANVQLDSYPAGVYVLQVTNEKGNMIKKIIKK